MKKRQLQALWQDDIVIEQLNNEEVLDKIDTPEEVDLDKILKDKKLPIETKLQYAIREVKRVLHKFIDSTIFIRDIDTLRDYIDTAIKNKELVLDTETNNSLDPLTCKIMGGCLYTPGKKQAYVPINHRNVRTGELLPNQITEEQFEQELKRLGDTKIIYHNAKFDYQVVKCTCNTKLAIDWDTFVGAYLIDEEGTHKLKELYTLLIDKSLEVYSIEKFFGGIPYEFVPIEYFGLYAAADAYETYKLYEWQKNYFSKEENHKLYNLFKNVEMPLVEVTAEMELNGIELDTEYAKRLKLKYQPILEEKERLCYEALEEHTKTIEEWRRTKEANYKEPNGVDKKTGKPKFKKSKNEQLSDPIGLNSPTQLAILLYDILKLDSGDKESPRATGEDNLTYIKDTYGLKLATLILDFREVSKLMNTYIEKLPKTVGVDGRIHCEFNQCGTDTGRYSSSSPNLQNIPSGNRELRLLFTANTHQSHEVEEQDDCYILNDCDEVETTRGWVEVNNLVKGDILEETQESVINVIKENSIYKLYVSPIGLER